MKGKYNMFSPMCSLYQKNLHVEYGLRKLENMGKEMEDEGCLMDKK